MSGSSEGRVALALAEAALARLEKQGALDEGDVEWVLHTAMEALLDDDECVRIIGQSRRFLGNCRSLGDTLG